MAAYLIGRVSTDNSTLLSGYQAAVPEIIKKYRGRFIARGGTTITLEGPIEPRRIVIIEFPELSDAQEFYHSHEYTTARNLREGIAVVEFIVVDGIK